MSQYAFDQHAPSYDCVAESVLGRELRSRVHQVLRRFTAPGDAVVDLGCGSGIDATWLAPQVASVVGFDASAEMVMLARRRAAVFPNVTIDRVDAASVTLDEPADVLLANFGVINCLGDLRTVRTLLRELVTPHGYVIAVTMTKWCPIELGVGVLSRNRSLLRRRTSRATPDPAYPDLHIHYGSARDLGRALAPDFDIVHAESLGVALPPFEQRGWIERRPRLRGTLAIIDRRVASAGAKVGIGDHHIVVLQRLAS